MSRAVLYLGERARDAAAYLNEMWERESPIFLGADGRWVVLCAPIPHEPAIERGVIYMTDADLIAHAEAERWGPPFEDWAAARRTGLLQ